MKGIPQVISQDQEEDDMIKQRDKNNSAGNTTQNTNDTTNEVVCDGNLCYMKNDQSMGK